jgi:hypothetical protein
MVVQFVGFMAGWNNSGGLSPLAGGVIGSLAAFVAVQWLKIGMMTVIAAAGMAGLLWYQVIISHF